MYSENVVHKTRRQIHKNMDLAKMAAKKAQTLKPTYIELNVFSLELNIFSLELNIFSSELNIFSLELNVFSLELNVFSSELKDRKQKNDSQQMAKKMEQHKR